MPRVRSAVDRGGDAGATMRRPRQVQSHLGTGENARAQERVAMARRRAPRTRGGSIGSRPGRDQSRGRVAREGPAGVPGQRRALGAGGQSRAAAAAKGEIRRRVETVRTVSLPYSNTQLPPNYHPITDQSPLSFHRCDNDPRIIASIAALFASDRKVDKARSWFNRACTLDPDIGDHWAAYYRFEAQHGGDEMAAAVAERCKASEPKHGELWQRVSKRVVNWHDDSVTLLKKCVAEMGVGEA